MKCSRAPVLSRAAKIVPGLQEGLWTLRLVSVSLGPLRVTNRTLLSSPRFLFKYFLPTLPKQYIATLTKRFNSTPGASLRVPFFPSTVRQSKLPSRPELLTEFWSSSAPKSLTEEDFPPKLIPTHGQHCRSGTHQLQQAGDYDEGQRPQAHGANWRDLRSCAPSPASRASPLRLRAEHAGDPVVGGRRGQQVGRPGGGVRAPGASLE